MGERRENERVGVIGGAILEALLSWCRTPRNINMGVETADRLLQLDDMNPGIYVVLSNIYAEGKRWDAVDHIRGLMRKRGLAKIPGYSLIEIGNQVYPFFASDDSHPKSGEIYRFLETLRLEVETCGYVPDTSCVLHDVDEQMKVKLFWGHSERLAIAFGILSTPAGSLIRITKNLRDNTSIFRFSSGGACCLYGLSNGSCTSCYACGD
ncbi:hypothetical protein ACSBR2_005287 [Camellia fascicularis]